MTSQLKQNLDRLTARNPALAERLARIAPNAAVKVEPSGEPGRPTGSITSPTGGVVTLASRRRPGDEAERFADQADPAGRGAVVVMGVGLGHHLRALAAKLAGKSLLIAYEPDESLLRSALEHVDADWLAAPHVVVIAGEADGATLTRALEPHAALIAQGVQVLTHPAVRRLQPERIAGFSKTLSEFVAYCRTHVTSSMALAVQTCRNYCANLGRYAVGETINDLKGVAAGRPAVLVAAGPSLARNVHLLQSESVRRRVVIIAAQTALKPLLARGIRPHFVTALDYHEISRRFYDGLPELPDVTLVAEPKANPAIVDAFPGPVRMCRAGFLDTLLGPLGRKVDALPAGSTVAHLSLYLAQHLGCDPIILTGQDLGFTDGLYYMPGTAIHEVWSPELNPFNTLEMLEWQRVARHRHHLRKCEDVRGKPIYTDEQMITYLRQFERDFDAADQQIIDATEGGMPKAHTTSMTLAEALEQHADQPLPPMPEPTTELDHERLRIVGRHLDERIGEVERLIHLSRQTQPLLSQMIAHQQDPTRMQQLFRKLEHNKRAVSELADAFALVNELNQIGAFNRLRADRAIEAGDRSDPLAVQRAQLERDQTNINWLIDACALVLEMFTDARQRLADQADDAAPRMGAVA